MIYSTCGRDLVFLGEYGQIFVQWGFLFPDLLVDDMSFMYYIIATARPKYRRNMSSDLKMKHRSDDKNDARSMGNGANNHNLVSEQSRTLKWVIQHYKPVLVMS